jgi:hypothetical protein
LLAVDVARADIVPAGTDFVVNSYTTGRQYLGFRSPTVARDGSDNFVIVWTADDGDYAGLFARRFAAAGTPVGTEFQVNSFTTGGQGSGIISVAPGGQFVVVWSTYRAGTKNDVFARSFAADGVPTGPDFEVDSDAAPNQVAESVAHDAAGNFVVIWSSSTEYGYNSDVVARLFDANGSALGTEWQVNTGTLHTEYPRLHADRRASSSWRGAPGIRSATVRSRRGSSIRAALR